MDKIKNNLATLYKGYKKELDSYITHTVHLWMPGCDDFSNQHIKSSEYDSPKVCAISVKFLSHLKEKNDSSYEEEGCKYLFYWLYVKALESKQTIENTLDLYKELNQIFNEHNDGYNKFDKFINQMNKNTCEHFQKIISLYEVFNIFENQQMTHVAEKKCTSNCFELFTSYVNECREIYDYNFCNELNDFREYHNYFIQKILSCQGEQYMLPSVNIFDTVSIILIPLVLILVTSIILPLLYKFTPVGTWIRHRIGKKKKIRDNINEETQLLSNTYEIGEYNFENRNYNIAYNSL
ncbi:PIR protein [Plasmodium ovale]|uniref:PIR protein n=1 Tax=Plasmodium ovale TaxID=36330 RepID=A0A1C3KI40_PLAOA|nr:PIR protein [Plasmodium ovale]